ncbi:hypothetical protein BD309DRAFT_883840 [Dichomitus squalens]|uniref:Uncharacterized protein n=1 Tax=Dichomitus squalens TaxID=114155 RepID=A0A4Q9P382_9APHY|nr:hypothetical protein BD309DRAFT_883840 [Dichomitus squalens]TBU57863.1 hypothetical protein BD310DRAFT_928510 [Dichomitus squalens]
MILTPAGAPPSLCSAPGEASSAVANPAQSPATVPQPQRPLLDISNSPTGRRIQGGEDSVGDTLFLETLKVPTVILETPSISHTMAAALSLSLLGHTLFLKSQVPFPIAQLSRMPGGKSNPKAAKKRDELLATFDILASHLQTTFVAISTAYAKCKSATSDENGHTRNVARPSRGTAHLMFVFGPSANAARARIVLTIDGLDVKVWGARPCDSLYRDDDDVDGEEDSDEDSQGSEEVSEEEGSDSEDDASEEDDVSDVESSGSDSGSGPPPSRSPSPLPPNRSLAPSPESLPSPFAPLTPLPEKPTPLTFAHPPPVPSILPPVAPKPQTAPRPPSPPLSTPEPSARASTTSRDASPAPAPTPELTYAEEQQTLRAAERLLSRTLMNAWVDGEGDMSSELAPTQTHLFLRAPRRFAHPAWAARQNLTRALDGVLASFLEDAGALPVPPAARPKSKSKGVRTEGAWIGCRGGSAYAAKAQISSSVGYGADAEDSTLGGADEEDEEIWWAWEGKIVGFADW